MAMVDFSKYSDDADRIAETLFQLDFKGEIKSRQDFDSALDDYLDNAFELRENKQFREMVFGDYLKNHPLFKRSERKPIPKPKIKRQYKHLGKVGSRIVYLRRDYEDTPKGKIAVYFDKNGKRGKVRKQ